MLILEIKTRTEEYRADEGFKYLGTGERGDLKECDSEGDLTLQKREANDHERKLKKGSGEKNYPVKKGPNVLKELK